MINLLRVLFTRVRVCTNVAPLLSLLINLSVGRNKLHQLPSDGRRASPET